MNPRRIAVEDRVLSLADDVHHVDPALAARLRECVPDGYGNGDEHVPLMRCALECVADRFPDHTEQVRRLMSALDNLPSVLGRRGRVWIAEDSVEADRFFAHWDDESGWLEQGPEEAPLDEVMMWARMRSDDIQLQRR